MHNGGFDKKKMLTYDHHAFIRMTAVLQATKLSPSSICLSPLSAAAIPDILNMNETKDKHWSEVRRIVDRVHAYICGHANYTDVRRLLSLNVLCTAVIESFLTTVVNEWTNRLSTFAWVPSTKVPIEFLNRSFNECFCIDHFYLDCRCLFHWMDSFHHSSTAQITNRALMNDSIISFQSVCIAQFRISVATQADPAFDNEWFKHSYKATRLKIWHVTHKHAIQFKHCEIRSIWLRLNHANAKMNVRCNAYQAVNMSHNFYGSDTVSASEISKRITKHPASPIAQSILPEDLMEAHETLIKERGIRLLLRSNTV